MTGVHDVAAAVIERLGEMTTMKLQKLVYYCQAWHLARHKSPMFHEEIQAWKDGPVVRALFEVHRGRLTVSAWERGNPANLSSDELQTVDWVAETYGHLSPEYLSRVTHADSPWNMARSEINAQAPANVPITDKLIYE